MKEGRKTRSTQNGGLFAWMKPKPIPVEPPRTIKNVEPRPLPIPPCAQPLSCVRWPEDMRAEIREFHLDNIKFISDNEFLILLSNSSMYKGIIDEQNKSWVIEKFVVPGIRKGEFNYYWTNREKQNVFSGKHFINMKSGKVSTVDKINNIKHVAFNPIKSQFAVVQEKRDPLIYICNIHDTNNGKLLETIESKPNTEISSILYTNDGKKLIYITSNDSDYSLHIVDTDKFIEKEGNINSIKPNVAVHPQKRLLAAISKQSGEIYMIDIKKAGTPLLYTLACYSDIDSVVFSPDGKYLAANLLDRTTKLWNITNESPSQPITLINNIYFYDIKFSPNSKRLLCFNVDKVLVIDINTKKVVCEIRVDNNKHPNDRNPLTGMNYPDISPSGNVIMMNPDRSIRVYDKTLLYDVSAGGKRLAKREK